MTSRYYRKGRYNRYRNNSRYRNPTNAFSFLSSLLQPKRSFKVKSNFVGINYPPLDAYYIDRKTLAVKKKYNDYFTIPRALRRDISKVLDDHIFHTIWNRRNIVCEINTKSGLGKSLVALVIYEKINESFKKAATKLRNLYYNDELEEEDIEYYKKVKFLIEEDIDLKYSADFSGSKNNIADMKIGGTNLQDELNELVGSGSRTYEKAFRNLIKSFRKTQKNFILATPDFYYVPNLHFILIPLGFKENKKKENWETRVLIRYIDYSIQSTKPIYLGYAWLEVGKIQHLLPKYHRAKDNAYNDLEDSGGMKSGGVNESQKERDINTLYEYAKKKDYDGKSKKKLKNWLIFDLEMDVNTDYRDYLIDEVYDKYYSEKKKQEEESKVKEQYREQQKYDINSSKVFNIPFEEIVNDITEDDVQWRNLERDKEIFLAVMKGKEYKDIGKKYGLSEPSIARIKKKFKGYISNKRGELYELYYQKLLVQDTNYSGWDIRREGGIGEPDVYAISPDKKRLHIFSLKCYDMERPSNSYSIKDFNAEIEFALINANKYDEVKCFAIIFDHIDKQEHKREINYLNPQKTILIAKVI